MSAVRNLTAVLLTGVALSACATLKPSLPTKMPAPQATGPAPGALPPGRGGVYKVGKPYQVAGIWYVPREEPNYDATGIASWYGDDFHMKPTANGEIFDMNALSAAHTTLPMPSLVEVTNLDNGRKATVRVNDRGPFVGGRLIDLSREAARQLGYERNGTANVRVRYIGPAPLGVGDGVKYAAATTSAPGPYAVSAPAMPPAQPMPPPGTVSTQPLSQPAAAPYGAASAYGAYPSQVGNTQPGYAQPAYPRPVYPQPGYQAPAYGAAAYSPPSNPPAYPQPAQARFKVQAAAFSDQASAQRVAQALGATGQAHVELADRNGSPIYRVIVQSSADEMEAWALRDRVAAVGYPDARVVRPF